VVNVRPESDWPRRFNVVATWRAAAPGPTSRRQLPNRLSPAARRQRSPSTSVNITIGTTSAPGVGSALDLTLTRVTSPAGSERYKPGRARRALVGRYHVEDGAVTVIGDLQFEAEAARLQDRDGDPPGVPSLVVAPLRVAARVVGTPGADLMRRRRPLRRQLASCSAIAGLRFPPESILLAVRWYLRFRLSYRDVEELLAERGVEGRRRVAVRASGGGLLRAGHRRLRVGETGQRRGAGVR
jgi:hypothetical protein